MRLSERRRRSASGTGARSTDSEAQSANIVPPMARPFRPSDRTLLLALSDAVGAAAAVLLAMWTWSLTAGVAFSWSFIRDHAIWFVAVPIWVMALSPTRYARKALDLRETLAGLLNASGALFVAYLAAYFYLGPEVLPRLIAIYILWNAVWL